MRLSPVSNLRHHGLRCHPSCFACPGKSMARVVRGWLLQALGRRGVILRVARARQRVEAVEIGQARASGRLSGCCAAALGATRRPRGSSSGGAGQVRRFACGPSRARRQGAHPKRWTSSTTGPRLSGELERNRPMLPTRKKNAPDESSAGAASQPPVSAVKGRLTPLARGCAPRRRRWARRTWCPSPAWRRCSARRPRCRLPRRRTAGASCATGPRSGPRRARASIR